MRRLLGRWWLIAIAVLLIAPNVIADARSGAFGSVSIFALSALGFLILLFSYAWFRQCRVIDDWVLKQGDQPLIYHFDEDAVTAESVIGKTTLKWGAFKKLTVTPLHTLLEFPRGAGALTLPSDQLTDEVTEFLVRQFQAHGLAVTNARKP